MLVYGIVSSDLKKNKYNRTSKVNDEDGLQESYNVRRDYLQKVLGTEFDEWCAESEKKIYIEFLKSKLKRCEANIKKTQKNVNPDEESALTSNYARAMLYILNEKEIIKRIVKELESLGENLDEVDLDIEIKE